MTDFVQSGVKLIGAVRERLTMVVTVGTMTGTYCLKSQDGIESESHCSLAELKRI